MSHGPAGNHENTEQSGRFSCEHSYGMNHFITLHLGNVPKNRNNSPKNISLNDLMFELEIKNRQTIILCTYFLNSMISDLCSQNVKVSEWVLLVSIPI